MSDAAAPGPSSGGPDDEPGTDAPALPPPDEPTTGLPDEGLVEEATSDTGAAPTEPEPTAEPPTGLPDATIVAEAETGPGAHVADAETDPGGDAAPEPGDEADAGSDAAPEPGDEADAGSDAAPVPDADADADAEPRDPTGRADLGAVVDGIAELRRDLAEARSGVESMLPDLAAAAREETVSVALAELAREETVAAGNARIQRSLDEMVRLTRRADDHVAELHAENQRLRAGELASATLPMVRDLVRLHDEVSRLAEASHPEARADLELVGSRLLDTLARWGLTPFAPAVGEKLDATRHQGVGRVPSSDGEPGTIATVRRPGFAHDDGRTFRPAEVEVFALPPPPDAPPTEEN